MKKRVFIIAEAGVNHNGRIDLAMQLVDVAKSSGADAVKFQTFISEEDVSKQVEKAEYQKNEKEETQLEMLKQLELKYSDFEKIKQYCEEVGILFLSSPFEEKSIAFLESMDMPVFKVASSEVTNYPFLRAIGKLGKPVILSTGMCNLGEVEEAIRVLEEYGSGEISLLHCNTEYPTPMQDVNLRAMLTLKNAFNKKVGYSDHTVGNEVAIAAVAMGAEIIEKHFTLDKTLEGPDHRASLSPEELKVFVKSIRRIEEALGSSRKMPSASEEKNIRAVRKSIVAGKNIKKGELLTEENLKAKRAGGGISPMLWQDIVGRKAIRDFIEDERIEI